MSVIKVTVLTKGCFPSPLIHSLIIGYIRILEFKVESGPGLISSKILSFHPANIQPLLFFVSNECLAKGGF